mmetsp:Transcript_41530/g.63404  ORF Transcript_41530/g.63404 Transcript_41530/m.63404 type:complete len:131 (+) Transcript_41530:402-794(+)|eukprot:CAMPEP_0170510100 /NCGR_PEP_ID=MMETSP0208-20121228/65583_1 /TAXON_ID=197538 /ORGANISM="Strombidium inclinatum, Strain S3" /LENGTH=130 /DNA_ID=CAMNT_0010793529 /DNA_START=811 /DNA_END=1203 /DNA_ORIENTATION=+
MICEEFGGTAIVHSKKGQGSVFQATLPLICNSTNPFKRSKEEIALSEKMAKVMASQMDRIKRNFEFTTKGIPLPWKDKKILVVDDEAYNTEVLEIILGGIGISPDKIVTCLSGSEAIEVIKESIQNEPES